MLSTGITELNSEKDINYLRESLCLSKTEEQADAFFTELIWESLKSKATPLNNFVHNVVHSKSKKKAQSMRPKKVFNSKESLLSC